MSDTAEDFREVLRKHRLLSSKDATLTPLTGGVSCEIYRVNDGERVFVVKRALARLKVEAEWFADVGRNATEQAFLRYVGDFLPAAVPRMLQGGEGDGWFAMEFLADYDNWKQLLLSGRASLDIARRAGEVLGAIHSRSRGDLDARRRFATDRNFHDLRIAPYLLATAARHPRLAPAIQAEAARLAATRECLVHGDFSPKNILVRPDRLVLLDCEVGWFGDPAFDVAFLLNHLFLKALYHSGRDLGFDGPAHVASFIAGYSSADPLATSVLERVPGLLRWLLLARVDGKSPVEYLDEARRQRLRDFVFQHAFSDIHLSDFSTAWFQSLPIPSLSTP